MLAFFYMYFVRYTHVSDKQQYGIEMTMKNIILLVFCFFVAGCVSYTPVMKKSDAYQPGWGYLYGTFKLDRSSKEADGLDAAVVVRAVNSEKTYNIVFSDKNKLDVIKLPPGKYLLDEVIFVRAGKKHKKTEKLGKEFTLGIDEAVYLGSYLVSASESTRRNVNWIVTEEKIDWGWRFSGIVNAYDQITKLFEENYTWAEKVSNKNLLVSVRREY